MRQRQGHTWLCHPQSSPTSHTLSHNSSARVPWPCRVCAHNHTLYISLVVHKCVPHIPVIHPPPPQPTVHRSALHLSTCSTAPATAPAHPRQLMFFMKAPHWRWRAGAPAHHFLTASRPLPSINIHTPGKITATTFSFSFSSFSRPHCTVIQLFFIFFLLSSSTPNQPLIFRAVLFGYPISPLSPLYL